MIYELFFGRFAYTHRDNVIHFATTVAPTREAVGRFLKKEWIEGKDG